MRITPAVLVKQASEALARWPFIAEVETRFGLPRWLLLAVGSRETNLRHVVGDGGHGHGPWQLDDRVAGREAMIARIDSGDTRYAAEVAASKLSRDYVRYRDWVSTLNVYNSGQPRAGRTTGGDYGPDVWERRGVLDRALDHQPHPQPPDLHEDDMIATDPNTGDYWVLNADGGVDAYNEDGTPGNRYYGNFLDHPEYDAGAGKPNGPAVGIGWWRGAGNGSGYVLYSRDSTGRVHAYHMDETTRPKQPV